MKQNIKFAEVHTLKTSIEYAQGATVSKIVTKNNCGSTTLFSFDKGQNLSEHTAPFDAIAIILDGKCKISIAGKSNTLTEGQMIVMPANIPHALEAIEAFKMMLVMLKA
ncbi:cupin domain-containing protein [Winogradskyella vincentii]|uniref:Cupin domain-containing protein n=1 Tax=Winogradskyella vincentii TaxID=2877122 RepID=A0ABS7Y2R2_9FLAO|nr:cupin domain-containing protein [Winogradskyella vincentii]MCA0153132.1 cupin domain-containing protein [Winogradskyella vincentii]